MRYTHILDPNHYHFNFSTLIEMNLGKKEAIRFPKTSRGCLCGFEGDNLKCMQIGDSIIIQMLEQ